MAGRQRTFELVPTTLAKPHGDQPTRMTSKQIKKAYQQANRGPQVSRAEQRRLDAEELDRQKKEYERERAAAKAKAAREKKAAKENTEKEARRKMGLPEPSRFVRASQPTISTFIRNGVTGKRSWQQMEMETLVEDSNRTQSDAEVGKKDCAQPPAKRVATADDSEDEFGDFPSLSQSDILEKIDSSMISIKGGEAGSPALVPKQTLQPPCQEPSQELLAKKSSKDEYPFGDSQLIAEIANTQLLSEAAEAAQRSDSAEVPEIPLHKQGASEPIPSSKMDAYFTPDQIAGISVKKPHQPGRKTAAGGNSNGRPAIISRPHFRRPSGNMLPPPVPFKEKKAISFASSPQKAKIPSQDISKRNSNPYNIPPSATQVFLENHLDDFFPSPTQEIRELLSDVDDLPSNTQVARELSPEAQKEIPDHLLPKKLFARGPGPKPIIEETEFEDLISTQDLILSSQELLEITTPSRPPTMTNVEPGMAKEKPARKPKPRFFEEKEDDILYAVLYESRTAAARAQTPAPRAKETKRTFFEEKEDDLLAAAIHESKMMAEMQGILGSPLKVVNGNERKKRALKRGISSASTDYGEDGFSGDEWEFLGF